MEKLDKSLAIKLYNNSIKIGLTTLGENNISVGKVYKKLGDLFHESGKLKLSLLNYESAFSILINHYSIDHPEVKYLKEILKK